MKEVATREAFKRFGEKKNMKKLKKIKCYETIQIQEYLNTDKLDAEELTQNVIGE